MSALNGVFLCDMVLKGPVLSICESLTVNVCNIKPIRTGAKWGLGNKGQQGSLCRSFSGYDHTRVLISEIAFSSQVACFFFSPRFGSLKADFHSSISRNRSHFGNLFLLWIISIHLDLIAIFCLICFRIVIAWKIGDGWKSWKSCNFRSIDKLSPIAWFSYFFINAHAQTGKSMAILWFIAWNAWMEINFM